MTVTLQSFHFFCPDKPYWLTGCKTSSTYLLLLLLQLTLHSAAVTLPFLYCSSTIKLQTKLKWSMFDVQVTNWTGPYHCLLKGGSVQRTKFCMHVLGPQYWQTAKTLCWHVIFCSVNLLSRPSPFLFSGLFFSHFFSSHCVSKSCGIWPFTCRYENSHLHCCCTATII